MVDDYATETECILNTDLSDSKVKNKTARYITYSLRTAHHIGTGNKQYT